MRQTFYTLAMIPLMAFAGGFCAQMIFSPTPSQAQQFSDVPSKVTLAAEIGKNNRGIQAQVSGGQPAIFLFGEDGKTRLQLGTYKGGDETGLPMIGFTDNQDRLRMLFRLSGNNQSPTLIMKDKQGRDRVVLGLSTTDKFEIPYLNIMDDAGAVRNVF